MEKDYRYNFADLSEVHHNTVQEGIDEFLQQRKMDWLTLFVPQRRLWERLFHSSLTKKESFEHTPARFTGMRKMENFDLRR